MGFASNCERNETKWRIRTLASNFLVSFCERAVLWCDSLLCDHFWCFNRKTKGKEEAEKTANETRTARIQCTHTLERIKREKIAKKENKKRTECDWKL